MGTETLAFELLARDRASSVLAKVGRTSKETAVAIELAQIRVEKATAGAAAAQDKYGRGSLQAREASAKLAQAQVRLQKSMQSTEAATSKTGDRMERFRAISTLAWGVAGAAVVGFAKEAVQVASDVNESQSKVGVVFGQSARSVIDFSKTTAASLGVSKAAALEAAGTFGNLFVALKLPQSESARMSTTLVKLAADMASFNNADPSDVLEALRSGLVGETEPLRAYGVNLSDATLQQKALEMGLVTTTKQTLPPAIKAQAAYALILDQTKTAQGDFARTSGGLANQQRIMKARFSDLQAEIGSKLLPVMVSAQGSFLKLAAFISANWRVIGPLVAGMAGLAAAIAAVNVASRAWSATSNAVATVRKAIEALGNSGSATRAWLIQMAAVLRGPWGIAIGTAVGIVGYFIAKHEAAKRRVQELRDTLDSETGALTKNTAEWVTNRLEQEGVFKATAGIGANLQDVTQAALGSADALSRLDQWYRATVASQHAAGKQVIDFAEDYRKLRDHITGTSGEIGKAISQEKAHTSSAGQVQQAMQGMGMAVKDAGTAMDDTRSAAEKLKDALDKLTGKNIAADEATISYRAAVAELTQSLKDNGRTLDFNTDKGRANRSALINAAKAATDHVVALRDQGASLASVTKIADDHRRELEKVAQRLGLTKDQAHKLIGEYYAVPKSVRTNVSAPGLGAARAAIKGLRADIQSINGKTVRVTVNADGSLTRRIFDATGRQTGSGTMRARGGIIPGPPSTSDTVPAWLSTGEYVVNAKATQRNRGLLEAINASGYASGGIVVRGMARIPHGYGSATNRALDRAMLATAIPSIPAGAGGRGGNAANIALGQALAAARGWTGSFWSALRALWMGESGWNNLAKNPTSTAFGIPQFLAGTARQYGVYGVTDPRAQIVAGMRYISDVYGNPATAYSRWRGRSPHWYDRGGWLEPGLTLAYNGTGRRERVLPPQDRGQVVLQVVNQGIITSRTDFADWLAAAIDDLQRKGKLRLAA